jgi:hypothetical protein
MEVIAGDSVRPVKWFRLAIVFLWLVVMLEMWHYAIWSSWRAMTDEFRMTTRRRNAGSIPRVSNARAPSRDLEPSPK